MVEAGHSSSPRATGDSGIFGFGEDERRPCDLGFQRGIKLTMPLSRPMPTVAPGVEELRIRDATGAYRVFYYLRDSRGVLVFHAFVKKAQKTPAGEIETGKRRLKELLDETP
jgi:phage-related protein